MSIKPRVFNPLDIVDKSEKHLETGNELFDKNFKELYLKMKDYKNFINPKNGDYAKSEKLQDGTFIFEYKIGYFDYLKIVFNNETKKYDELEYSHKCVCCKECEGKFIFAGKICKLRFESEDNISNIRLIDGEKYNLFSSKCYCNINYNLDGKYVSKVDSFDVIAKYDDGAVYKGLWKKNWPNGFGVLNCSPKKTGKSVLKSYTKTGMWKNGLHLKQKHNSSIELVFDSEKYNYARIVYSSKNSGCIEYFNKSRTSVAFYSGNIYKFTKNSIGDFSFKTGVITRFIGIFINDMPIYGLVIYKNGLTYTGYVNEIYKMNGCGIFSKKYYNHSSNTFGLNLFEKESGSLEEINGFWMENELIFRNKYSSSTLCSISKCTKTTKVACVDCKLTYCNRCFLKHCRRKCHTIYKNLISDEKQALVDSNLKEFELRKEKILLELEIKLKLKLGTCSALESGLGSEAPKETELTSKQRKQKKKNKMKNKKRNDIKKAKQSAAITIQRAYKRYKEFVKIKKETAARIIQRVFKKFKCYQHNLIIISKYSFDEKISSLIYKRKGIAGINYIIKKDGSCRGTKYNGGYKPSIKI